MDNKKSIGGRILTIYAKEASYKGIISLLLGAFLTLPQLWAYFWGSSLLKPSCNNLTLRQSLRGVLCTGIFSAVMMIVYGLCNNSCRYEEKEHEEEAKSLESGKIRLLTKRRNFQIPLYLIGIIMILIILNL